MPLPEGLKQSLNAIREVSSEIYHRYVPIIEDETDIAKFASPILEYADVRDEFMSALIKRIVYTQFTIKYFRNPLQVLEGDRIPLGHAGQEIYVNPAKGRKFNPEDFAGLLTKYEADIKVQYMALNMDVQYPVSILRQSLKQAFVSWGDLETFIDQLSNSLYNGAYIDEYRFTKNIISSAYMSDKAIIKEVTAPSTEALAKQFITEARTYFLNFQTPSSNYNSWAKVKTDDTLPIVTWTLPEDIVFIVRNDIRAFLDVNVLASAFNIDKAELLGNILTVDNFDVYNDDGQKVFDGSPIIGMIADKSWFRIKRQDMFLDTFYNPNNRTTQYYLNLIKMYNMSLFANGVIFATELPNVDNDTTFGKLTAEIIEGSASTKTKVKSVTGARTGATLKYIVDDELTAPKLDDTATDYSELTLNTDITCVDGDKIIIVEVDSDNKIKSSSGLLDVVIGS